jgi:hypothetical protein
MLPDKSLISSILDKKDVELFMSLRQFVWIQGEPLPLIYEIEDPVYAKHGINLIALKHLKALGLIFCEPNGYVKKRLGKHTRLFYHGSPTKIQFPQEADNQLDLGHVLLTDMGKTLATVSNTERSEEFYKYVIEKWFRQGLIVSSILTSR